jgi:hypothetical protein
MNERPLSDHIDMEGSDVVAGEHHRALVAQFERELIAARIDGARLEQRLEALERERDELLGLGGMQKAYEATLRADAAAARIEALERVVEAARFIRSATKFLTPEQIAEADPMATAILDCACGDVRDLLAALAALDGKEEG